MKCIILVLNYTILYGIELFDFSSNYMSDLYIAWRKVRRYIYRSPSNTHSSIIIKLEGCIEARLDRRLAKFIFNAINHSN